MLTNNYSEQFLLEFIDKFIDKHKNSIINNIFSTLEDEVYLILSAEEQDKINNYLNYNDIDVIKKTYREFNLLIQKIYDLLLPKLNDNNIVIENTNYYIESSPSLSSSSDENNENNQKLNINITINDI